LKILKLSNLEYTHNTGREKRTVPYIVKQRSRKSIASFSDLLNNNNINQGSTLIDSQHDDNDNMLLFHDVNQNFEKDKESWKKLTQDNQQPGGGPNKNKQHEAVKLSQRKVSN
jgi:hypothetical protein